MRLPLTRYGWPEAAVFPAGLLAVMVIIGLGGRTILPLWVIILLEIFLIAGFVWSFSFFRDPSRLPPDDRDVLLAPADGQITNIDFLMEDSFIGASAVRIGIFLSIFDVHINRSPCDAKVERIVYKRGGCKNARNLLSGQVNESNDIALVRTL